MTKSIRFFLILLCVFAPLRAAHSQDRDASTLSANTYTTIKSVTVTPLSNGVQIRVLADGILQHDGDDSRGNRMRLNFPSARNGTGKTFINVNRYPVSYLQLQTPQNARNGIGLQIIVANFVDTRASISSTPDGQGVIMTVLSDRTIEGKRAGVTVGETATAGGGKGADTSTFLEYKDAKLTLRAVRADIHSLIGAIAQRTGLAVGVDDSVDRKVSLNLIAVDPQTAVQSIATAYGLALARLGGITMLSEGVPTDLATYRLSGTESYRMQNTQAATASGLLPNFLFSYVRVNPEQNAVVVNAPSQMLAKIGADLAKLDIVSPQIAIEAIAVELTDNFDRDFNLLVNQQSPSQIESVNTNTGEIRYSSVGALPKTFDATLTALVQNGKARVRARPQMAVVNGKTANIFIGAQRFILTQFNSFGQTQVRIQPVDVGVKLAVTPLTGGNGEITTNIAPEVSNITELDLATGLPVLSTRRADTTVRVKDGETIAIGGLTLAQEQAQRRKIPILGDLPFIGPLFRSVKRNTVQTELVIFITPRIVTGQAVGDPTPPVTTAPPVPEKQP